MRNPHQRRFRSLAGDQLENEIEEELRFHLESLTDEHLQQDLTLTEAKAAALRRFGNVEQVKIQCVEISRSNKPLIRILKVLLIALFLLGVLIRASNTEIHVSRIGDILMFVGVMGRLLLYLRGWHPVPNSGDLPADSILMLGDSIRPNPYEHGTTSPVERIISDK